MVPRLFILCGLSLLSACASYRARVHTAIASAVAPADPATPAKVEEAAMKIPAGSKVEVRRETVSEPMANHTETAKTIEIVTVTPSAEMPLTFARAESGTQRAPDIRAEIHAQDTAARRPLLLASIGAALLAALAVYLQYPTPAVLCGLASIVFFVSWKLTELPGWIWAAGLAAVAIAAGLYFGHERGEAHASQGGIIAK